MLAYNFLWLDNGQMIGSETNILQQAYYLTAEQDRNKRIRSAMNLGKAISHGLAKVDSSWVTGELATPNWVDATTHLIERRSLNPIEAWMVAETIATGVTSAHTMVTGEAVSEEEFIKLTEHLALGALALTGIIYTVN
jgi:hypothetical protein